ncbi:MAG: HipA domain-containing protein [Salinivirgaceae bacterium]|nr:HipA domain-containing protein [Salinivirgaceae bacterium]
MASNKKDILVYAHWKGMTDPKQIGILSAHFGKGRKSFSFEYNKNWLKSQEQFLIDPDIGWFTGPQFPGNKANFGIFLDSMPDTWGRTLMKRRNALIAREKENSAPKLYDIDFLLGVYDESRMGALRFKLNENGPFLDDNADFPTPPWSSVRELQFCTEQVESDTESADIRKWLAILMAPGSSLGGARPKANILDDQRHPWIAKFPSKNDTIDKALWELLAYKLAINAGIEMAESKVEKVSGNHHTFFTKRFDRENGERLHFASAMTMTGNSEDILKEAEASYLSIAEFIQFSGARVEKDLHQLWRRIVFNIAISNTDDHLRNHGFILTPKGWILSPAFDINPSIDKDGLAINIDLNSNALDFNLAKSVGEYFMLKTEDMNHIIEEIKSTVSKWENYADQIGISRSDKILMQPAFRF